MATAKPTFNDPHAARLQITAGAALLRQSKLIHWTGESFTSVNEMFFEERAAEEIDFAYGRLICWLTFSAGAEYLLKGVLLAHGIMNFMKSKELPAIPCAYDIDAWLSATEGCAQHRTPVTDTWSYGTIGDLVNGNRCPAENFINRRIELGQATADDRLLLLGAYRLLGSSIRNRDAHAHIPNVRRAHFELVQTLFLPAISLLVRCVPDGGGKRLKAWLDEAPEFLRTL